MKKFTLITGLLALLPFTANADLLSTEIGIANWNHKPSGEFLYQDTGLGSYADLEDDLNLDEERENFVYFTIRHAVPAVPNFKFMSTSLSSKGSGQVESGFYFDGTYYTAGTDVNTELTLDHNDATLFWNILDTVVTLDIGITARSLDGKIRVNNQSADIDGVVPMGYGAIAFSPIDSLRLSFELNALSAGESSITDSIAKVSYFTSYGLGLNAGIRTFNLTLDDLDGSYADVDFSGLFAGVSFKF